MHTTSSWGSRLHGSTSSSSAPLKPPLRPPYAQMRIEISRIRIDINNEICTLPTGTGHVSIIVDPESVPQALITSDTALASETTSIWPTLDSECFSLDVRPSSRLLFQLYEGQLSKDLQYSFFVPVAELFAGISNSDDGGCIYEAHNKDGKLLLRSTMTLMVKSYPQYSAYTSDDSPYRLPHLDHEKYKFSDMFSWEVGVTLECLIAFLDRHDQQIPELSKSFLRSTMSVFWRITQDLGQLQSQPSSTDAPQADSLQTDTSGTTSQLAIDHRSDNYEEVSSGGEYLLRDIVYQMGYLLGMRISGGPGRNNLLLAIQRELCLYVAVLEANTESYRDMAWMKACLPDQARTFVKRQQEQSFLALKCAVSTKDEPYNGVFDDGLSHMDQELITHYIARLRALRPVLQLTKLYPVMVFEITSLKVNGWHSAASRISLHVSLDDTDSIQPSPVEIYLNATSAWERSDPGMSLWMVVRPSSCIQVEIFDVQSSVSDCATLCASIPLAELVASGAGEADTSYEILDENGKTLLTLVITADIRYYAKLQDLERQESVFNAAGLSLENTPTIIEPYYATHAASDLLALLYQHRNMIDSRIVGFLSSAATGFTRIIQHLKQQTDNFGTQPRDGNIEYHKDLLQDLMTQMITTIRLLQSLNPVPQSFNGEYISEIFGELCRCVGLLEGVVGCNGETKHDGEGAVDLRDAEYTHKRQQQLFLLLSAIALQVRGGMPPIHTRELDGTKTIEQLLALTKGEFQRHPREKNQPTADLELGRAPRLFTSILMSLRGKESDRVFTIIEELLQREPDAASRDAYRRALIKLVQAADRLPNSLWILVETSASGRIAVGGFADVYKGKIPGSRWDVAVKSLRGLNRPLSNVETRRMFYNEIILCKTLRHDRLLPFLGICTRPDAGNLCMVSPFMSKGTLLANCNETIPSTTRLRYITEIVEGMTYLHGEGVMHGNLRAVNILLTDDLHIVIVDFSLSVVAAEYDSDTDYSTRGGDPKWTAPELLFPDDYNPEINELQLGSEAYIRAWYRLTHPTKHSDVYSFAFLCIEVYTGQEPFPSWRGDHHLSQFAHNRKLRPERPLLMTNEGLWILVQDCWDGEAANRPSFDQIQEKLRTLPEVV